ncbi:hypothetical protein E05_04930 [Plautia stali symbiont]|nr:hypothetical protein E05_04930 [Plautia stali symbiont]
MPHTLCLHHPLFKDNPAFAMFELPFATPEVTVSQLWHPRLEQDAALRSAAAHRATPYHIGLIQ